MNVVCVAWRFCRAGSLPADVCDAFMNAGQTNPKGRLRGGYTSGEAAKFARKIKIFQVALAPISSRFLCPRPPLLLNAPNQNRHATQATLNVERLQYCCRRLQSLNTKLTRLWLDMNKISKSVI